MIEYQNMMTTQVKVVMIRNSSCYYCEFFNSYNKNGNYECNFKNINDINMVLNCNPKEFKSFFDKFPKNYNPRFIMSCDRFIEDEKKERWAVYGK